MKRFLALICLLLAACGGPTTTRKVETGYRGKAKLDAYLAAARLLERMDYTVVNQPGWPRLQQVAVMLAPASVLSTNAAVREVEKWVEDGGHLICLVERAESYHDDWWQYGSGADRDEAIPEALDDWFKELRLQVGDGENGKVTATELQVDGDDYEVAAESYYGVRDGEKDPTPFAQAEIGEGIVTVMMDARPFRNRYIGDSDHAELLLALVEMSPYWGDVAFLRDGGISLWSMLWRHGWPALLGLAAVTVFWLWKNMPRFGPMEREEEANLQRDYDHHLEALGDFQWRLDRGAALLRPLRESLLERAQRSGGQQHGDLFEWLALRSGMTRERAERAMTHERPADATSFSRVVADLQKLHLSLP